MKKMQTVATIIIIITMIILNFAILYMMIDIKCNLKNDIGQSVNKTVNNLQIPESIKQQVQEALGEAKIGIMIDNSVNKKVDSLNLHSGVDGKDGKDGKNSVSTDTVVVEKTIKQVPVNGIDGLTPIPRCNKARWEVSYDNKLHWSIMLDENNKPVSCSL